MNPVKPLVYILDDDATFNLLMEHVLKKLGLEAKTFLTHDSLMEQVKAKAPALFFIDLNLDSPKRGFELIDELKKVTAKNIPIFIVSTDADPQTIAHAIELGAADYLIKPMDKNILVAKLSTYLKSQELEAHNDEKPLIADNDIGVTLKLDVSITQIDETSVTVVSKHLISKGTVLAITGPVVDEILGAKSHILATTISNSVDPKTDLFKTYLEFDSSQKGVGNKVRSWIIKQHA